MGQEPNTPRTPIRRQVINAWYRGVMRIVAVEDIIYLRADHKYVSVRHPGGTLLVDESLCALELEFPDLFLRLHRNALVARTRLSGLEKQPGGATLARLHDCDDRLPVSRRHIVKVRHWLNSANTPHAEALEPRRLPDQSQ